MSGWTIEPIEGGLGRHAAEWDALNWRAFGQHPLLTSMFVNGLLEKFGEGREYLCVQAESGQIQAMCILQRKSALVWTSFLPSQAPLAPTLMPNGAMAPSLLQSLPRTVAQLDLLCNDPQLGGITSSRQPPTHRVNHALTIKVDLVGTFDAYWASRSKQLRANFRRYEKRLLADGLAERLICITEPAQMEAAVGRYANLEGAGWKGQNGTALGSSPSQLEFYCDLMARAAESGNAVVHELWFGDQLAASRLVLSQEDTMVILKTSYDERLASYAPGRMLLRRVIDHAFSAKPGGVLEFYTNANADQLTWATAQRWIQHASYYRWPLATDLLSTVRGLLRGARHQRNKSGDANPLHVDVYRHPDQLPEDVQGFMRDAEQRNIGFGGDWYRNLIDTVYPGDDGIRFYALRKETKVIAVLPLRARREGGAWQLNALSNFYTTLFEPVLARGIRAIELTEIFSAIEQEFPHFAALKLSPMDPASDAYQILLEAMRFHGLRPYEYFAFGNWYQPVCGDWKAYLAERDGTLRSTIKRMAKKFEADGGVLEIVTDAKDVGAAIAAYSEVYAASWKRPEEFPDFMPGLLTYCSEKGMLRLGLAWLNGQPIAAQVWIVAHGRSEMYKVAHHQSFKAYAPGTLITAMLMKHAYEVDKVREVDYLIGDDAYKKMWMSHRRERWGILAYNPRSPHGMAGFVHEVLGRAVKAWRPRRAARADSEAAG